jgi:hypothetical protein
MPHGKQEGGDAMGAEDNWTWPPSMDAVVAAPESHRVLFCAATAAARPLVFKRLPAGDRLLATTKAAHTEGWLAYDDPHHDWLPRTRPHRPARHLTSGSAIR